MIRFLISSLQKFIITPIYFFYCIRAIYSSFDKENIFIFHHGWGIGVTLHDTEYIRRKYDPKKTIIIFFNNGKHNYLIEYLFSDITFKYIKIYSKYIKIKGNYLTLNKRDSILFYELFVKTLRLIFSKKYIQIADEYIKNVQLEHNVSIDKARTK